MRKWLFLWLILGAVALAAAAAVAFWFPGESETTAEVALRKTLTDDQAWDALANLLGRHFTIERSDKHAADGTGVLYTGWVTRMHGQDLGGKKVRVMLVLDRGGRKVRLICEAMGLEGEDWKPASDGGLLRLLKTETILAVGDRPAAPT